MTRDDIIRITHANFDAFFDVWKSNMDRGALGALVFVSRDSEGSPGAIECVYMTLTELRDYFAAVDGTHASAYRWVKQAESVNGIPVVILQGFNPVVLPSLAGWHRTSQAGQKGISPR